MEAQLSPEIYRALRESFRFEFMSKVQDATLDGLLRGEDCFAKAKTGGGKTLGFLVPALDRLLKSGAAGRAGTIGILIISPTRELAQQILEEAKTLASFLRVRVDCCIGGTNINGERGRFKGRDGLPALDILVATPGRCVDHIETSPGFPEALGRAQVLILDEADRLLDMGFEKEITRIQGTLPKGRQTFLFSATVPEPVKSVAHRLLKVGYPMVDTVGKEDTATNPQVTQEVMVLDQTSVFPALARVLAHIAGSNPRHKTVVFLTTARMTGYVATLFERAALPNPYAPGGPPIRLGVVEMHSRKSQSQRNQAAERFRAGSGLVMFSSDVSARGMDYPGITEVIQVGLTDRESYIHRLGRTARAGREGAGLLLVSDYEARVLLPDLQDLPLSPSGPHSELTGGAACGLPGIAHDAGPPAGGGAGGGGGGGGRNKKADGIAFVDRCGVCAPVVPIPAVTQLLASIARDSEMLKEANQAYGAALGFYNACVFVC